MEPSPRRRLEDRIRELCAQAVEPNWRSVLAELRTAIHEHALKMSNLAMAAVVGGQPHLIRERRERRCPRPPDQNEKSRACKAEYTARWPRIQATVLDPNIYVGFAAGKALAYKEDGREKVSY